MTLSTADAADVARHQAQLTELMLIAEQIQEETPEAELCPRQAELLARLDTVFAGQSCPPELSLLSGGLAEDDYRSPAAIRYIDATDDTPRDDWPALTPPLLLTCRCGTW